VRVCVLHAAEELGHGTAAQLRLVDQLAVAWQQQ